MPELKLSTRAPLPFPGRARGPRAGRMRRLVLLLALVLAPLAHAGEGMPADALGPLLAGEFALQSGQLEEAARWYLEAARGASDDVPLAERATRIAILANDDAVAGRALALWRERAPESPAMRAASRIVAASSSAAGTARLARPHSAACAPVSVSPVNMSCLARAAPRR